MGDVLVAFGLSVLLALVYSIVEYWFMTRTPRHASIFADLRRSIMREKRQALIKEAHVLLNKIEHGLKSAIDSIKKKRTKK